MACALLLTTALAHAPLAAEDGRATPASASPGSVAIDVPDLRDTLNSGLKARRPEEFAFTDRVVVLVEIDRLPLPVVESTFKWARPKKPQPYPYFARAMRIRAARLGIQL